MADSLETLDQESVEDVRAQLQERAAESLADLSDAIDAPSGVQVGAPFDAADVDFESNGWLARIVEIQGWLRFEDDLPDGTPADVAAGLASALGFEPTSSAFEDSPGEERMTTDALEALCDRLDVSSRIKQVFLTELEAEGGNEGSANAAWIEAWESEEDNSDTLSPEPVKAKATVWPIFQLASKSLNLNPSYQRGDVWKNGDRQALVESILRGIPLPSIILLRTGPRTPHEVVDGKQRLTAILRFVGKHPVAQAKVAEAEKQHPDAGFTNLFSDDYPKFRRAWKSFMGEPLSARLEDEYYFPFKLRSGAKTGLVGDELEPLQGKYFTQIKENVIQVASSEETVQELFEGTSDYAVPVIEYTEASQTQIHEVFKLYNKQGMHLNAEEIRNAVYHEIELTRAILVAAGDVGPNVNVLDIAPSLANVSGVDELGDTLHDYGFGESRYRRTKVLGWLIATLLNDTNRKLLPSTARHIDSLLGQVQNDDAHPLRDEDRLADLFNLIVKSTNLHASHGELWPDEFRGDGKSSRWQDLQLIGSLLGITIAVAIAEDEAESNLDASADAIRSAALDRWARPEKTQTRTQWDFIARIAADVVELMGLEIENASQVLRSRFGSSGVKSLLDSRTPGEAE